MTDNYLQISPQLLYLNLNLSLDVAAGTKSVDVTMSYELTFALLAYNRFYFFASLPHWSYAKWTANQSLNCTKSSQ